MANPRYFFSWSSDGRNQTSDKTSVKNLVCHAERRFVRERDAKRVRKERKKKKERRRKRKIKKKLNVSRVSFSLDGTKYSGL